MTNYKDHDGGGSDGGIFWGLAYIGEKNRTFAKFWRKLGSVVVETNLQMDAIIY